MELKRYTNSHNQYEIHRALNKAIGAFEKAAKRPGHGHISTTPVMKDIASKSMLFSEDFSDITFQCSDGISIPAHKVVLAASSSYFKTALKSDSNWAENNADGIWKTSHPSKLIKSFLRIIYTGSIDECDKLLEDKDTDPLELFDISCQYNIIKPLILLSLNKCVQSINGGNIKD